MMQLDKPGILDPLSLKRFYRRIGHSEFKINGLRLELLAGTIDRATPALNVLLTPRLRLAESR